MDVEFSIADTFEELRPDWKRAETGEVNPATYLSSYTSILGDI